MKRKELHFLPPQKGALLNELHFINLSLSALQATLEPKKFPFEKSSAACKIESNDPYPKFVNRCKVFQLRELL